MLIISFSFELRITAYTHCILIEYERKQQHLPCEIAFELKLSIKEILNWPLVRHWFCINMESPLYLSLIGAVINLSYGILIWLSMCACAWVSACSWLWRKTASQSVRSTTKKSVHIMNQRTWESIHRQNCIHTHSHCVGPSVFVAVIVRMKSPHRRQNNTYSVKLTLKAFLIAHLTLQMFNLLTSSVRGTKPFNRPSSLLYYVRASEWACILSYCHRFPECKEKASKRNWMNSNNIIESSSTSLEWQCMF